MQTIGMIQRAPQLESALLPLGIEAAWKLMYVHMWNVTESYK